MPIIEQTKMYKFFAILATILILGSCTVYKYLPGETIVERRDSIIYKVDTLKIELPVETIKEVVPSMDTLFMETSIAEASAWVDTSLFALKGTLKNKKTALTSPQIVYKEKISYRDSIVYKPYPVEVVKEKKVVPKWCWRMLVFDVVLLLVFAAWIYLKISKVDILSLFKKI